MSRFSWAVILVAALPALGMAQNKELEDVATLRKALERAGKDTASLTPLATPCNSSNVPSAHGGSWGSVGLGFSYSPAPGEGTREETGWPLWWSLWRPHE